MEQDQQPLIPTLCEDIWANIFCKLTDCKEVIRFTSVCKQWHQIIHQCLPKIWGNIPLSGLLCCITSFGLLETLTHSHSIIYASLDGVDRFPIPQPSFGLSAAILLQSNLIHIIDSFNCCNGLFLFHQRNDRRFSIWNPTTNQWLLTSVLPPSDSHRNFKCERYCDYEYAALAFDLRESSHYRIVRFPLCDRRQPNPPCLDIYHSESHRWICRPVRWRHDSTIANWSASELLKHATYYNGVLYRLSFDYELLCFNLNELNLDFIDLPKIEPEACPGLGCIGVSKRSIHYANVSQDEILRVWMLDEEQKWRFKYSLSTSKLKEYCETLGLGGEGRCFQWIEPMAFHPEFDDIVFIVTSRMIFSYDSQKNEIKIVYEMEEELDFAILQYFPAFTFTPCPINFYSMGLMLEREQQ